MLIISGCSVLESEQEVPTKAKTYSSETERYFESIEKTQVGDLYQKNLVQPKTESRNTISNNASLLNTEYERGSLNSLKKPHPLSVKEVKLKGHPQLKRELNQILSFHCMKHRKRFSHESVCIEAVNKAINQCELNHQEVKPPFVKCLKAKLRNI